MTDYFLFLLSVCGLVEKPALFHFYERPAPACSTPARAVFPVYHAASLFVNRKFVQIFSSPDPEICANFLKILLAFPSAIPYNNNCQEENTTTERKNELDKRIKYLMGLDTETANGLVVDDKLDLSQSLVYDIGWAITDKRGNIYKTRSFLIYEVFVAMKDIMQTAYYADKIPMYWEQVKSGQRKLVRLQTVKNAFWEDIKEFGVSAIFAHNARFDYKAMTNTIRWVTKSNKRFWFPRSIEIWDTLKMARQTIGQQKSYKNYCIRNGYMTKHKTPRVRLTAEILYRYISGNNEFDESHTGLEDVLIETKILVHCFRQHKKMDKKLFNS